MNRPDNSKIPNLTQVTCWLDEETHRALEDLTQSRNLKDIGEAIRLLVDFHHVAHKTLQAIHSEKMDQGV